MIVMTAQIRTAIELDFGSALLNNAAFVVMK
jgi:hypothetical protein